jgi:hypothetical protein
MEFGTGITITAAQIARMIYHQGETEPPAHFIHPLSHQHRICHCSIRHGGAAKISKAAKKDGSGLLEIEPVA